MEISCHYFARLDGYSEEILIQTNYYGRWNVNISGQ